MLIKTELQLIQDIYACYVFGCMKFKTLDSFSQKNSAISISQVKFINKEQVTKQ